MVRCRLWAASAAVAVVAGVVTGVEAVTDLTLTLLTTMTPARLTIMWRSWMDMAW